MERASSPASPELQSAGRSRDSRVALLQVLLLILLCFLAFRAELPGIFKTITSDPEWAFCFATPVLVLLLFLRRRREIVAGLTRGTVWGIVFLIVTFALYCLSYNYTYPRRLSVVPAIGASVLAVAGWRVLKLCLPMLLMLLMSFPTGMRAFARIIIEPETVTMEGARFALDLIPGVQVMLDGADLSYIAGDQMNTIALGEHNRGASFFFTYLIIGIYLTFVRIRPWWQVAVMLAAAVPIVLASNFLRVVMWGGVTMAGGFEPTSPVPRVVATAGSLIAAYALFVLILGLLQGIITEDK